MRRQFENEVIKLLCPALDIEQKLHCSYRPEASGLVEQMNGTLKSRMAKMCAATNMKWPDALPLILMSMRNPPDKKTGLSPHEILMGRAMRLLAVPANALVNITDDMVLDYCKGLADVIRSFSHQVEANTLPPIGDLGHTLQAGDWVFVKKHVRKLEISQEGTETAGEPTENSLVPQRVNEFERGDSVPISVVAAGELNQGEVLPEVDGYGLELEPVTDQEEEEEEEGEIIERDQSVPPFPEPVAGPSNENTILQEEVAGQRPEKLNQKKTHKGDNWPEKPVARSKWTFMLNGQDPAIPGIYYICGLNAYYRLPKGSYGTCYLGIVFPKIYQIDDLKQIPKTSELQHARQKRESVAAVIGDIFGAIIPSVGVILNSVKIQRLSTIADNMLTNFTGAILLMDTELAAERAMTLQNRLALDILLAKSGGVCKMLNERHCCSFIPDNSKKIRSMLTDLTKDSADLKDLKEPGVWEKFGKGIARYADSQGAMTPQCSFSSSLEDECNHVKSVPRRIFCALE
ncbi:hypothetical protein NDU88_003966 [Pleurodeles waltl]|uniref:Integrase catalytic domain-containing protein n=1 Tax=Pleurodeles waltl TaxID=8319 RepID=A0AAV7T779_PLEWA|nr:hypothetical protein NDU88_003966 [Pleurodeles waltl]